MKVLLRLIFSVVILIGFIMGGLYLIQNFENITGPAVKEIVTKTVSPSTSENTIESLLPEASACEKDDECILAQITPACGCHYVINKHYNPKNIEEAVAEYKASGKSCGEAHVQCMAPPAQKDLKCISGKCDIVRPTKDPSRTFSDDPKIKEQEIKTLLESANYCVSDDNCVVADIDSQCPFGCYNLVSKNADLSLIKEGIAQYRATQTPACMYKCLAQPEASDIKCINNKCVDQRVKN